MASSLVWTAGLRLIQRDPEREQADHILDRVLEDVAFKEELVRRVRDLVGRMRKSTGD